MSFYTAFRLSEVFPQRLVNSSVSGKCFSLISFAGLKLLASEFRREILLSIHICEMFFLISIRNNDVPDCSSVFLLLFFYSGIATEVSMFCNTERVASFAAESIQDKLIRKHRQTRQHGSIELTTLLPWIEQRTLLLATTSCSLSLATGWRSLVHRMFAVALDAAPRGSHHILFNGGGPRTLCVGCT